MNINEAKQILVRTHVAALDREVRASSYVLESGPGIGKSDGTFQGIEQLARELDEPCGLVQMMLSTLTSPDVRGFMIPLRPEPGQPMKTIFSVPPWMPGLENTWVYSPPGVIVPGMPEVDVSVGSWYPPGTYKGEVPEVGWLFLDELGQAEEDVKKPAAELILHGNVGTAYLPMGWRVVAAQNRMSDRSGTIRELMFVVNRRGLLPIEPHLPTWLKWANSLPQGVGPHFMSISFAQKNPDIVFRSTVPDSPDPFCSPRSLCLMDRDLQALASEEDISKGRLPMSDLAREVCAGWIGAGSAAQFFTHMKFSDLLPEMSDIESDPGKAKVPEGRDAQMVCAYMLSHHINEDNAESIMKYVLRLGAEMQILAVQTITSEDKRRRYISPIKEYRDWLLKNSSRLIAAQS